MKDHNIKIWKCLDFTIAVAPHNHVIRMGDQPTESIDKIYQTINGKVLYKALKKDLIDLNYCETIHTAGRTIHVFFLSDNNDNRVILYLQKL